MPIDLGALSIQAVIVHDIPEHTRSESVDRITYSERPSDLNTTLRQFMVDRVGTAIRDRQNIVHQFDDQTSSDVPNIVRDLLSGSDQDIVEASKAIARTVYDRQTGASSAGLLFIIECRLDGRPAISILKLDRHRAIQAAFGRDTFDLNQMRDLVMNDNARIQKSAIFVTDDGSPESVYIRLCDLQLSDRTSRRVAEFFRSSLGVRAKVDDPATTTFNFRTVAERFFNEESSEPDRAEEYEFGLIAEMLSNDPHINPRGFAERHLPLDDQDRFVDYLIEHDVPDTEFPKDVSSGGAMVRQLKMDFIGGMTLIVPHSQQEYMTRTKLDDGRDRVVITGRINRINGRG